MSYFKRFITTLLLTMVLSSVSHAGWVKFSSQIGKKQFHAISTYGGNVIPHQSITGKKRTISDLIKSGQIELRNGEIIYPSEIEKALVEKSKRSLKWINGRVPHTED